MPEFARRIHGSSDLFEHACRAPRASLNFICSHDGFTLRDLVSYRERNNIANKENNRDGHHTNHSENYGVEGETKDSAILAVRARQQRNLLATLLLSQGTPMLLGGDELSKSQGGNNNAYCQDNEMTWAPWGSLSASDRALISFTQRVISLRQTYAVLRSETYIHQPETLEREGRCARWISATGEPMTHEDWHENNANSVGWILESVEACEKTTLLVLFNARAEPLSFHLPSESDVESWSLQLDSSEETGFKNNKSFPANAVVFMDKYSLKLLVATHKLNTAN